MIAIRLSEIAVILSAKHVGIDVIIEAITINSNNITQQCMFIALIGNRFDGHNFAEQAVITGAQAILVNHYLSLNVPQLIVVDTHYALIQLATWIRHKVSAKIIAITGSSGKTSVKAMTTSILKGCGNVISTVDNSNNLIGVPMTMLSVTHQNDFAVIELGASSIGEMSKLSKIVSADVALVNNIYPSHLLGFKSLTTIKKEKGEVFSGLSDDGHAVINCDNHAFSIWNAMLSNKNIWRFSLINKIDADFFASNIVYYSNGVQFILHTPCGKNIVFLPMFFGLQNVANALAASALAFSVGANLSTIVVGLQNTQAISGRLYPIILNKGKLLLLDDTYNSNVGSMVASVDVLNSMPGYRILVMSDMLELGESQTIGYHRYIGRLISNTNINKVFTIGSASYVVTKICNRGKHFYNTAQLLVYLYDVLNQNHRTSLLIKGSRNFYMERLVCSIKDKFKCYSG